MLVFFLIAGTVAPPLDPDLQLVDTTELEGREPPDALVLHKDGSLTFRGTATDPGAHMSTLGSTSVRIVPDREVSGSNLFQITAELRRHGATSVFLVTQKTLE